MNNHPETTIFLVCDCVENNGTTLGVFTDRSLAEEYAEAADGVVEECPVNVPKTKWMYATARLSASKIKGQWRIKIMTSAEKPFIQDDEASCHLGHNSGWGVPDPASGQYTCGHATSVGKSEDEARKMCEAAFWAKVKELDTAK